MYNMDKNQLNLPLTKETLPPPKSLSMDQYLEFVLFNLQFTVNIDLCREAKSDIYVDKPFKII